VKSQLSFPVPVCQHSSLEKSKSLLKRITHSELNVVTNACNPSFVGGRDWEDHILRPAWAKVSEILPQKQARHGSAGLWSQLHERHRQKIVF
jgi:hypothetical protein